MNSNIASQDKELQKFIARFTLPKQNPVIPRAKRKKIIIISGPTCVGKTKRSLIIAHALGGEIISADSMQVYRGMDIGTDKVSKEERLKIPHHLIDCKDLQERFNVMDFYREASKIIEEIYAREHVPIIVGGTGFYLHALIYGPPKGPPSAPEVRLKLEDEMKKQGTEALYERLKKLDPDYAKTITQSDKHKIIRALEIIDITNNKVSEIPKSTHPQEEFDFRCWFLYLPKEALYPQIEMRCDEMIAKGFLEEVRSLENKSIRNNPSASQAIGYRQALQFLTTAQSDEDFDEFVALFKQASRRYAKRQFTWFRKEPLFRWLNVANISFGTSVEAMIQDYEQSF